MGTGPASARKNNTPTLFGDRFSDHQSWLSWLHDVLPKPSLAPGAPVVIDLFAGCGGLALGFEAQGFRTIGYEMKPIAVETYNANLDGRVKRHF
jgi:C-5 cytosine-specific DNA methylase